jgi:hypothetical protein
MARTSITTFSGKSYVVLDPLALSALLAGPTGAVTRHLITQGEKVKKRAIELAPVGKPDPLGRPKSDGTPPGNLRSHIVKRIVHGTKGVTVLVGVWGVPYARFVHEGAKPHVIRPVRSQYLVFMGSEGQVVFAREVNHPGNKPNRFLNRALDVIK